MIRITTDIISIYCRQNIFAKNYYKNRSRFKAKESEIRYFLGYLVGKDLIANDYGAYKLHKWSRKTCGSVKKVTRKFNRRNN